MQTQHYAEQSAHYLPEQEPLRELQKLFLVDKKFSRKEVAATMRWDEDALSRCINGQRSFPASKLPRLYLALGNYLPILKALFRDTDIILLRHAPTKRHRVVMAVLADLTLRFGAIYDGLARIQQGETLMEEELREIEQNAQRAKEILDEVINLVRQISGPKKEQ